VYIRKFKFICLVCVLQAVVYIGFVDKIGVKMESVWLICVYILCNTTDISNDNVRVILRVSLIFIYSCIRSLILSFISLFVYFPASLILSFSSFFL
jgi:hypothetical protein